MPLLLIEGEYRIQNAQPDGDSIRFYPDDKTAWELIGGTPVRANKQGGAQLRLDGIDALETHFNPQGPHLGSIHQPRDLGDGASAELLQFLGFREVERNEKGTVTRSAPDKIRGHILTRFSDAYGRVVAFAFKGNVLGKHTGELLYLSVDDMKRSWNYHALAQGFAYPTFYSKLFVDLRKAMAHTSRDAKRAKRGIWAKDQTYTGFELTKLQDLFDCAYIVPKLWRRLTSYVEFNDGDIGLEGFKCWLENESDRVVLLPDGQHTGFDFVVDVEGQLIKVNREIESLIWEEK